MDSKLTGMWVSFFTTAGIPSDVSATYALTFTENRIQNDMLLDLNKEYLRDMGITRMGDVIAILRHAKKVHESVARDRVLSSAGAAGGVRSPSAGASGAVAGSAGGAGRLPVATVAGRLTSIAVPSKASSPATRILEHYTRKVASPEASSPPAAAKRKLTGQVAGSDGVAEVKKTRMIRFGNTAPAAKTEVQSSVFARLGNSEITKNIVLTTGSKPIFSRLGAKSATTTPPKAEIPIDKDALKYAGILKTPIARKSISVTASKNSVKRIASGTMRADESPISVKEKLAQPKSKSVKFSSTIQYKEIENSDTDSNTESPKHTSVFNTPVFNTPERRLSSTPVVATSVNQTKNNVKARLGNKLTQW